MSNRREVFDNWFNNKDNLVLVTLPRSGGHYLKILMSKYFKKPILPTDYFLPHRTDYLLAHIHGDVYDVNNNCIVLLRKHFMSTMFSGIYYSNENITDDDLLERFVIMYANTVKKWVLSDIPSKRTIVVYENLLNNGCNEFIKICDHIGYSFDEGFFNQVYKETTKEDVNSIIKKYDPRHMISLKDCDYENKRCMFIKEKTDQVNSILKHNGHDDIYDILNDCYMGNL